MIAGPEVEVFAALGDPVRSGLVRTLASHGAMSTTALALPLAISRQAVDQHLRVLRLAGIVSSQRLGRETRHRLERSVLAASSSWLESINREWDMQLTLIKEEAERSKTEGASRE